MDHEEVAPLALIPDATLEVMLRQSMVAPSDASQLVLVDAFIVRGTDRSRPGKNQGKDDSINEHGSPVPAPHDGHQGSKRDRTQDEACSDAHCSGSR